MPACTSTSELSSRGRGVPAAALCLFAALAIALGASRARADDTGNNNNGGSSQDRTTTPEEEDFGNTPYTEYGEFNSEKEEEATNRFFQYGRFFGVSVGLGLTTADGDRGTLYQGGFPTFDFKLHYWFDFNFAMDMDFTLAEMYFLTGSTYYTGQTTPNSATVRENVSLMRLGIDVKYYFDVKNLSAPVSFANPYVLIGAGDYSKTETSATGTSSVSDTENAVGFNAGAGLEFALKPRAVYFTAEARIHLVQFADYNTQVFQASEGLPDQHGNFYTFIGSILFTW